MDKYVLLDGARMKTALTSAKELAPDHVSLYRGRSEEELAAYSPYLFPLKEAASLAVWVHEIGWGNAWGIFIRSGADKAAIFKHFRKFLMVSLDSGEEAYFRFYDPRVLRVFLPTCDPIQLREFFGPVHYFFMEDEDPCFSLKFWLDGGQLRKERREVANLQQYID